MIIKYAAKCSNIISEAKFFVLLCKMIYFCVLRSVRFVVSLCEENWGKREVEVRV